MRHSGHYIEGDLDARVSGAVGQTDRVIEQEFVRTYLDQQRG
jgi:hypothetical protein